jgi:hypothetical protein
MKTKKDSRFIAGHLRNANKNATINDRKKRVRQYFKAEGFKPNESLVNDLLSIVYAFESQLKKSKGSRKGK